MKICVLTPIWKRHDLTDIFFSQLREQQKKFGFDVLIVGSEGAASELLVANYGFQYLEFENSPLGRKMNAGLGLLKEYDAVVVLGSDDFISDEAWKIYQTLDLSGKVYYGFRDLYFYSTKNHQIVHYTYKGVNIKTIGAGRIYSKACLESVNYHLWTDEKELGLDTDASGHLSKAGCTEKIIPGVHLIDVKHAQNITDHAVSKIGEKVMTESLHNKFGESLFFYLKCLDFIPGQEKVERKIKPKMESVTIRMVKDAGGMSAGREISTSLVLAKSLVRSGKAVIIQEKSEVPFVATEKTETPVEVEKERCIPCEQKQR